jgi:predicted SAM-dependent methyltransferase
MLKSIIKSGLRRVNLYRPASNLWMWLRPKLDRPIRFLLRRDQRVLRTYFASSGPKKLHVGCGPHDLEGWLNADLFPRGNQIRLDATKRFPLDSNAFDFVYTEHMIEHIPWTDALHMLKEIHRVLKPGGTVRIATPNMGFLTGLLGQDLPSSSDAYLRHNREIMTPWAPDASGIFVFNHFMRAWGHQFIFDPATLTRTMEMAGFSEIVARPLNESPQPELCGLAAETRMPPGFLAMETMVFEGAKV